MVLVDNISELEYFNVNPDWGCYSDFVTEPHDILLQVYLGMGTSLVTICDIYVLAPDGTVLENATTYFDVCWLGNAVGATNNYYANIRCNRYSPAMISNKCFILQIIVRKAGPTGSITKYTQKYELSTTDIYPDGVFVKYDANIFNIATLCSAKATGGCNKLIKIVAQFDCVDTFTGDFYGTDIFIFGTDGITAAFPFVRFSYIEGFVRKLPTAIKRTISINCRTQRSERTNKYLLSGTRSFPLWKMQEIEGMLLANHFFVDGQEYQSEGGTPFEQLGTPKQCVYAYKLLMELQDCYQWQIFGCTPPCQPIIYYYPIAF